MRTSLFRFAIVGVAATVGDLIVYTFSLAIVGLPLVPAKAFGFLTGTSIGFVLNRQWTFQSLEKPARRMLQYFSLYSTSMIVNVLTNYFLIQLAGADFSAKAMAFTMSTLLTATLNYTVLQGVIFAKRKTRS